LLRIGRKLYPPGQFSRVQRLPFDLYCKHAGRIDKAEVLATMFVAANTSIPVPAIIDAIGPDKDLFVVMTRVPGQPVSKVWLEIAADPSALANLEKDLRGWLYQLRSLMPPSTKVSNFLGGSSWQHRVSACEPIGPFPSKDKLHEFLLSRVWCDEKEAIIKNSQKSFKKPHRICFTHGELRPHNILILNGRLSGLIGELLDGFRNIGTMLEGATLCRNAGQGYSIGYFLNMRLSWRLMTR
jgi:hypothetical protein